MVATGRARGDRRAPPRERARRTSRRAALEAIAWRVADVLVAVRESVPGGGAARRRRPDPEPALLSQLQADAAGVAVQPGAVDATAAGAAALAAVGAGIWESTLEIGERIPAGTRVEPERDDAWREREHAAWREFVERAVALELA